MHKIRSALNLSWSELETLIRAWFLLFIVDLALRFFPFTKVRKLLIRERQEAELRGEPAAFLEALRMHRLVQVSARHHIYPMSCLRQALVLQHLLNNRDIVTELRFGVQKATEGLMAHAWVEYDSQPVGETDARLESFAPMVSVKGLSENDSVFLI